MPQEKILSQYRIDPVCGIVTKTCGVNGMALWLARMNLNPNTPQLKPFPKIFDPESLQDGTDRKEPMEVPVGAGGFPDRGIATRGLAFVGTVTVGGDAS